MKVYGKGIKEFSPETGGFYWAGVIPSVETNGLIKVVVFSERPEELKAESTELFLGKSGWYISMWWTEMCSSYKLDESTTTSL